MTDALDVKEGHDPEEVAALIEALRSLVTLDEGELYTLRKGQLHHVVPRDEENGLRRIKVMEEAHDAAQLIAKRLRRKMRGFRVRDARPGIPGTGGRRRPGYRLSPAVVQPGRARAGDCGLTDRHLLLGSGFGRKRPTVAAPGLGHRERCVRSVGSEKHGIVLFRGPSGKRTCALGMACSGMGPVLGKTPMARGALKQA